MAQAIIDGHNYDLYSFNISGEANSSNRYIRTTKPTLSSASRTVVTTHKKQFNFSLLKLTETERNQIITSFQGNTFSFQPLPYDSTNYTVKVINDGKMSYNAESIDYFDITGITLEIN